MNFVNMQKDYTKHIGKERREIHMKKTFIEPDMRKIELNLSENIATSSQDSMGYRFWVTLFSCTIQDTGKYLGQFTEAEAENCKIFANARMGGGTVVPVDEARLYF